MRMSAPKTGQNAPVRNAEQRLLSRRAAAVRMLIATLALAMTTPSFAENIKIAAPHLGDDKPLRAQWFTPEAGKASGAAAILLHGCGGLGANGNLNARHKAAKDWLLERGIAVVLPESFTSRNVEQICTERLQSRTIHQSDRVQDVIATRAWLNAQPGIDSKKIVLWGWSHGGSTVLSTVTHKPIFGDFSENVKFAEAIAFYPGCSAYANANSPQKSSSPLTILMGEADDWTPAAPCAAFTARLKNNDQDVSLTLYPGAFHDFDNPAGKFRVRTEVPNGVNTGKGVTVAPDPKAREDAMARIDALLIKHNFTTLKRAPAAP